MSSELVLRVFDVEHGACAILGSPTGERIAMIDSGHNASTGWRPSSYIRYHLNRDRLDYLFITNADQDHISDLDGLWEHGIEVTALHRNLSPAPQVLRLLKEINGELTNDIERYLRIHADYTHPVPVPFNVGMSGVTCQTFCNAYPEFTDTNNLSLAVFIKYGAFKILFPGDLEADGWMRLIGNPAFVRELTSTTILVASHHGRYNGFCKTIFNYFTPQAVVISDKPIVHDTQEMVPDYREVVNPQGVIVTNQVSRRHVLTTHRDGDIIFNISSDGRFLITTSAS